MSDSDPPDPPPGRPLEMEVEPTLAGHSRAGSSVHGSSGRASNRRVPTRIGGPRLHPRRTGLGDRGRPARRRSRLPALRPPAPERAVVGVPASACTPTPSTRARARSPGMPGLHGLMASQVASTASSDARWIVFILMIPAVLYALAKLYRAIAIVHALVWRGSGRGVRTTPKESASSGAAILRQQSVPVGRREDPPARSARRDQRASRETRGRRPRLARRLHATSAP